MALFVLKKPQVEFKQEIYRILAVEMALAVIRTLHDQRFGTLCGPGTMTSTAFRKVLLTSHFCQFLTQQPRLIWIAGKERLRHFSVTNIYTSKSNMQI